MEGCMEQSYRETPSDGEYSLKFHDPDDEELSTQVALKVLRRIMVNNVREKLMKVNDTFSLTTVQI